MSRQFEHYREFEYQEDYEKLIWQREQEKKEWEEIEQLNKHKNYGYEFKKSNPLESEDQIRA